MYEEVNASFQVRRLPVEGKSQSLENIDLGSTHVL